MLRVLVETVEFQLWIALLEMGNRHRHIGKYSQCIDLFGSSTICYVPQAIAIALGGVDGGFDDIGHIILQHMYDINGVFEVSQHEGILFSLSIKSIKATSMLERLDRSLLWLYCGGGARCADIHHHLRVVR